MLLEFLYVLVRAFPLDANLDKSATTASGFDVVVVVVVVAAAVAVAAATRSTTACANMKRGVCGPR